MKATENDENKNRKKKMKDFFFFKESERERNLSKNTSTFSSENLQGKTLLGADNCSTRTKPKTNREKVELFFSPQSVVMTTNI